MIERFLLPRARDLLRNPLPWVLLVYVSGIVLRVIYTLHIQRPEDLILSDMDFYVVLARKIAAHDPLGPWEVTHPLGYSALLAFLISGTDSLARAVNAQIVISALVPPAVGLLGGAAYGRRTGLLATVFASLYFPFIDYGALFLAELPFILSLALAFAALLAARDARRRAVSLGLAAAGGVALSLAASFKSVALPAAIVFFAMEAAALVLTRANGASSLRARLMPWLLRGLVVACAAAPLLGVLARACTRANEGRFCVTGNKAASDFFLGHTGRVANVAWETPTRGIGYGSPGSFLRNYDRNVTVTFAIYDSAANIAAGLRWIAAHPGEAIVLSIDHIYDTLFGVAAWPTYGNETWLWAHVSQYLFIALLFVPFVLAWAGIAKRGLRAAVTSRTALVTAPIAGLLVTVVIATGEVRYRIPFDVFFIAIACAMFTRDLARVDGSRASRSRAERGSAAA